MNENSAVSLPDRALLSVIGEEGPVFLQGLITNDIHLVSPERTIYASLLTAQGKYLHDFIVFEQINNQEKVLILDGELNRINELEQTLIRYRLRTKVDLKNVTDEFDVLYINSNALSDTHKLDEEGSCKWIDQSLVTVDPRLSTLGLRAYVPLSARDNFLTNNHLSITDKSFYEQHRLRLGIPDGTRDLLINKDFPLEFGFNELNAISYDKGCFVGQELTARTNNRGTIKRKLFMVKINGAAPASGKNIILNDRTIGTMRSSSQGLGLAHLLVDAVTDARASGSIMHAGEAHLTPVSPAWASY